MKKITIALAVVSIIGTAFVSFWVYDRYFKRPPVVPVTYTLQRGDIHEQLHIRGDIAAEREYDLAFESFGTVAHVYVDEGDLVKAGAILMRLDTTDLSLELERLYARRLETSAADENAQAQYAKATAVLDAEHAKLAELRAGTSPEKIEAQRARVDAANVTLLNAEISTEDAVRAAYTVADDAVRQTADLMMSNPRTSTPELLFILPDDGLRNSIQIQRQTMETILRNWKALNSLPLAVTTSAYAIQAQSDLNAVKSLLDDLALALNAAIESADASLTDITTWRSAVSAARTTVDVTITSITQLEESREAAAAALTIAEQDLRVLEAGTTHEAIATQEAIVRQAEAGIAAAQAGLSQARATTAVADAEIAIAQEEISRASIYAPGAAKVTKLWLKEHEQYQQSLQGMPAISLATIGVKVQSDVSEIDIPKLQEHAGMPMEIVFDAFPERVYTGEIVSIEPKEILKEGDTYYRVNFGLDTPTEDLRRGMSGDLTLTLSEKADILKVPEYMVTERDGTFFVNILENGTTSETAIQTGVSDGDYLEVVSGITDGQIIVAPVL